MGIIEEMWYGNLHVPDNIMKETKESRQLLLLINNNKAELEKTLTENQNDILEKYLDCMDELGALRERRIFTYAFCLGAQITAECLKEDLT